MENVLVILIIVIALWASCSYIIREKKRGRQCIGCPYSGRGKCNCKNAPNIK